MHSGNKVFINSIGTALPPHRISQQEHHSILESANGLDRMQKLMLRAIYKNSGINSRQSVMNEFGHEEKEENIIFHPSGNHAPLPINARMELFDKYAPELATIASGKALDDSGFKNEQVTHLIVFSCTGMSAPGLDIQLAESLKLKTSV